MAAGIRQRGHALQRSVKLPRNCGRRREDDLDAGGPQRDGAAADVSGRGQGRGGEVPGGGAVLALHVQQHAGEEPRVFHESGELKPLLKALVLGVGDGERGKQGGRRGEKEGGFELLGG